MDPLQAARHSAQVAALFDRVAHTYDAVGVPWFEPIAERLVAELSPAPGERALDLGTGRGAALWPLARGLGSTGQVTGLDLSPEMVNATRLDARERRLSTVNLVVDDAGGPHLAHAQFDLAAASLVLFFLPDPPAALRAWRELLVPGGRLGVSTFGTRDPAWERLDDVFTPFLPPALLDARTSGTRGPFASDLGVEQLLEAAGFTGVRTARSEVSVRFVDVEQWRLWSWSHGQRSHWDAVPEERRAGVLAAAAERLDGTLEHDGGFTLTQQVRFTIGRRPEDPPATVR
ncbi:class I SAM-dependent methyltransferase [Pengzhenrongella frigida]|uniref:Methyltransferase domain-containing protein n=1 Tax=Pengzhenrongella frigida TaxID=1259133 RepID=A0A4Q5MXX9_9MICO|nr:class I SAM-dependent methyltransferase [Cellulomonas sp. HLT2-17]RYV49813.1 methyltransferase domain-containing protein [Cellulomonas sp. HLT2-17]